MHTPYNVKQSIISALAHMLAPLVRMLLKNGVTYTEFSEVAKQAYVNVCAEVPSQEAVRTSEARIAILTGLSRKEVTRISSLRENHDGWKPASSRVAAAIQGWLGDKDFVGPYGVPRIVHFDNDEEGTATFKDLVHRHLVGADAEEVLHELIRSGAVTQSVAGGPVQLMNRELKIEGLESGVVNFYAREIRRFLDTSLLNMSVSRSEKIYQRWVIPDDGICAKDWEQFAQDVRSRLDPVLTDLDARFSGFEAPQPSDEAGLSVGVGFYVFREPLGADPKNE